MTILGTNATVDTYATTLDVQGQSVDVTAHLTTVTAGDDYVVLAAIHPKDVPASDAGVRTMFEGAQRAS